MKNIFGIIIICIEFFIPFIILIFCYVRIVWMLSRRISTDIVAKKTNNRQEFNESAKEKTKDDSASKMKKMADLQKDKFQLARRNTIKTLLVIGCGFIVCWSQNHASYLLYNLGYDLDFNGTYFQYTVLMGFLNCTINPFIYLAQYRDYQVALRMFLRCRNEKSKDSESQTVSSGISHSSRTDVRAGLDP